MSVSLLEIVDRGEGEFILKRVEHDAEPLVTIRFSVEARSYMSDHGLEIAKAMIQAGFQAVAVTTEPVDADATQSSPPILH